MSLTIPANDFGQIRVFALSGPLPEGLKEKTPEALAATFGTDTLDPEFIDIVRVTDLAGLTLSDYIRQGYDMSADAVDTAALREIGDTAILVMSRATGGRETTLTLAPSLRHVTTCSEPATLKVSAPLRSDSSQGILTDAPQKPVKSDAAMSGRVATVALIVLFLVVGLMVWVAG